EAIAGAGALGVVGLNVTVPHKVAALALCRPDALARRVGAVNTLVYEPGERLPRGLNTDVHGFRALLTEAAAAVSGRRAVGLGAGGGAGAVVVALREEGAIVEVVSRHPRPLGLPAPSGDEPARHAWTADALAALLPDAALLVDTTPRGLDGSAPPAPLPL